MSELLFDAVDYSLFKRSLETTEVTETKLIVASLRSFSLFDRREELVGSLCSLIESVDVHILD